jgi:hypothetical protein
MMVLNFNEVGIVDSGEVWCEGHNGTQFQRYEFSRSKSTQMFCKGCIWGSVG